MILVPIGFMLMGDEPYLWGSVHLDADAGMTLCGPAPGAALSLYVTDMILSPGSSATTVSFTTGAGGSGAPGGICDGGTVATVIGVLTFPASASPMTMDFKTPIKLTANQSMCMSSSLPTTAMVNGFIAP